MKLKLNIFIVCIALCVCEFAIAQDISSGLIVEYNFNASTNDSSSNGFDAINNGASFTDDRLGNSNSAILFDGINDFLELPNISDLKPQLPVSFSFWIRYDSPNVNDRDVFNTSFEEDRNTGIYFNSQTSTGNFAVNYGDGGFNYTSSSRRTYVTDASIETGEWSHVAIVVSSATEMKIYINCVENGGVNSGNGGNLVYSDLPGNIGRHDRNMSGPANYFKGALDDFRYWNRDLLVSEIESLCDNLSVSKFSYISDAVKIHPNPSKGVFNIDVDNIVIEKIEIYNTIGQRVLEDKFSPRIDLSNMPKGIYHIKFISEKSKIYKKIIVN